MNSERKILRIGIAGAGFGLKVLLPVFAGLDSVRVVAACGEPLDPVRLPPDCRAFPDWEAMLGGDGLDAVALALPPLEQERAAPAVLAAGLHLFCEKPLAVNLPAAEAIAREATLRKLVGSVDFEFRKIPAFEVIRRNLPLVGRPRSLKISWKINARITPPPPGSWKNDAARGGGAMSAFGCHLVDLCYLLLGRLEVVSFEPRVRVPGRIGADGRPYRITAEDSFSLTLRSISGVPAHVNLDTVAKHEEGLCLDLEGDKGRLRLVDRDPLNYFSGWEVLFERSDGARETLLAAADNASREGRIEAVRRVAVDFIGAVSYGRSLDSNLDAGAENVRLVSRARSLAAPISP